MSATVGDLNPKTLENAKRQFVELYGSALVLNTYLKIALVLVSLVALGLIGAELPHRRALRRREAAGHPDRRGRPGRGRRVRRDALPAAAAGAALLPDAVRREALQPHPGDRAARVSRLAAVPRAGAGRRHDRPERPEPRHRDVPDEPVRRRGRRRRPERQPERADDAAVQGRGQLPEGVLHARARGTSAAARPTSRRSISSLREHVPNAFVRVNPLGLQVAYFRVDQAFEEARR